MSHTVIEVGGRQYRLSRLDPKLFAKFLDWANRLLPDPIDQVREAIKGFPPDIQKEMVREAMRQRIERKSGNSPEIQALMASPEGAMKILALAFQKNHPELTDTEVEALYDQCADEHGEEYLVEKLREVTGERKTGKDDVEWFSQ